MKISEFLAKLTAWVFAGAIVGVGIGFLLKAMDVVENPFWAMSAGIFVGAMAAPVSLFVAGDRREPGAD